MVDPVTRISSTAASAATQIDSSVVSRAEPDNVWAAQRQAQINADLAAMKSFREEQQESEERKPLPRSTIATLTAGRKLQDPR